MNQHPSIDLVGLRETGLEVPSDEALDRLVYVVGSARGGTTIFLRSLRIHPRVLGVPVTHFVDDVLPHLKSTNYRAWHALVMHPSFCNLETLRGELTDEQTYWLNLYTWEVARKKDAGSALKLYPLIYSLTQRNFGDPIAPHYIKPSDAACWIHRDTTWRDMDVILKAMPHAQFIFIYRDPRASISSMGLYESVPMGSRGQIIDVELVRAAIYWRLLSQKTLLFARKYSDRCLTVRYEDLVMDPVGELGRVYAFLGCEPMSSDTTMARLSEVTGRPTNSKYLYSGLSREPLDRWMKVLSSDQIALIGEITGVTARRIGYDIEGPVMPRIGKLLGRCGDLVSGLKIGGRLVQETFNELRLLD